MNNSSLLDQKTAMILGNFWPWNDGGGFWQRNCKGDKWEGDQHRYEQQWKIQSSKGGKWSSNSTIILQAIKLSSGLFGGKPSRRQRVCDDLCTEIKDLKEVTAVSCFGKPLGDEGTSLPEPLDPRLWRVMVGAPSWKPAVSSYVGGDTGRAFCLGISGDLRRQLHWMHGVGLHFLPMESLLLGIVSHVLSRVPEERSLSALLEPPNTEDSLTKKMCSVLYSRAGTSAPYSPAFGGT